MTRYYIREWDKRYEVDSKGRSLQGKFPKRAGPLDYVRLKVNGRSLGIGWRRLIQVAGVREAPGVFGIFCKILEVAADAPRDERGYVDDTPEEPLAFLLGLDEVDVAKALRVLSSSPLDWLVCDDARQQDSAKAENPEYNSTQLNTTQPEQLNTIVRTFPEDSGNLRETDDDSDNPLSGFDELVAFWNTLGLEMVKESEYLSLEPRYVALVTGVPPNRFSHEEIMGAMKNYKVAREFPNSQAHPHTLGKFLVNTALLTKYLPGVFNLPDHDRSRFNPKGNERNIPQEVEDYRERQRRFLSGE